MILIYAHINRIMKHYINTIVASMSSLKSKIHTRRFRKICIDFALNTETFKHSVHYITFRILISIASTIIMMLSCFILPDMNPYLRFFLEITACLYIQKIFVICHPYLLSLQNKTTFITNILIIHSKKAMFFFSCEICLYVFVYIVCFIVNISSNKIQYMILQQIVVCTYNNFSLIYERYIYFLEYKNFEIIEFPKPPVYSVQNAIKREEQIVIKTKNDGQNSLKVVHDYFN